jgi:hypothetical protein
VGLLGFQECNANCIAMVDDDDVQYMMENSACVASPAYSAPRIR